MSVAHMSIIVSQAENAISAWETAISAVDSHGSQAENHFSAVCCVDTRAENENLPAKTGRTTTT